MCVCVCVPENRALTDLGDRPVFVFFPLCLFTGAELFASRALKSIAERGKKQIKISREYFFRWLVGWSGVDAGFFLVDYRFSFISN